jgi:predicted phage terminase large subunit-like protein
MTITNSELDTPTFSEIDAVLRQDFLAFTSKVFATLNPGREFKRNWHHSVIAYHLTEVMEGRCQRLIINIPPRYLKSIMASVALPAFLLGHDPTKRIICASYAQDLSSKLSRDCRTVMETAWYRRIFPAARLNPEHKTESDFATVQKGMRYATSVGGVLTGLGGDAIIIDDPIKPADAASEKARETAIEWFNTTVSTRLDDKNKGAIVVIMQRLHLDDLTGHLIRARGWTLVNIPAIATAPRDYRIGKGTYYHREMDEVLQPEYESKDSLMRAKRTMGNLAFEAQYQQNPVPDEGAQLKREWFRYYTEAQMRNRPTRSGRFQSWDTASTSGEFSDYSVATTWYVEGDTYYLQDVLRKRLLYPDLKKEIIAYSCKHDCHKIIIEEKGAGQHLIQEFRERGTPIIPYVPKGDKVMRLATVSPLFEAGAVYFPDRAPWLDDFLTELLQFPNGSHDDQVDSVSQFLNYMERRKTPAIAIYDFNGNIIQEL